VPRLRIGSIEPNEVSEELLNLMSTSKSICPHLHLPLQSGSDSVLNRMGRTYTSGFFRDLIARVSAAMPDAFIGVDVIAGFPEETEEEFAETVQLCEDLPLSDLHVFPYSSRPGTRAAGMPGHIPARVVTERAARMRSIATLKKKSLLERFVGREIDVLVQGSNDTSGVCRGLSRNYISTSFPGETTLVNKEVSVLITGCSGDVCTGVFRKLHSPAVST